MEVRLWAGNFGVKATEAGKAWATGSLVSERCENSTFLRQYPIALSLLRASHMVTMNVFSAALNRSPSTFSSAGRYADAFRRAPV